MSRAWKRVAKCAYLESFSVSEISEAIQRAAERDCRAELSSEFLRRVAIAVNRLGEPDLFRDISSTDLDRLHHMCTSTLEAGFLSNIIDEVRDGYSGDAALQNAAEGAISDRMLAGYRQIEEHLHRDASDSSSRSVRARLESAHDGINTKELARMMLRKPDARVRTSAVVFSGLDDGVSL
jgi:hypothetical protein